MVVKVNLIFYGIYGALNFENLNQEPILLAKITPAKKNGFVGAPDPQLY